MLEISTPITKERTVLQGEKEFFGGLSHKPAYLGVLTNAPVSVVTKLYPEVVQGIRLIYDFMQDEALDLSTLEGFTVRYLEKQYLDGNLIPDDEVDKLRTDIASGRYSKQYEAYVRYRQRMSAKQRDQDRSGTQYGAYRAPMTTEADVMYNKRMIQARALGMQTLLQGLYGEVDYQRALLTELVINAPFVRALDGKDGINEQARTRHQAFLNEVTGFSKTFDPQARVATFEELTSQFPTQWTYEGAAHELDPVDLAYVQQLYAFAGELKEGTPTLDELYPLLSKTILRRNKLFVASHKRGPFNEDYLSLRTKDPTSLTFDDIAGYKEQKDFYRTLLTKMEKGDPIVGDIRMIIAAGEPGRGKSMGVEVFLNNLPPNSKGILVSRASGAELDLISELAKLHPDQHIWVVLEDIDAVAGDRLRFSQTFRFLELDSAITDTVPNNLHILATTNRPDVIDPAVIRPGRTAKILVYDDPSPEDISKIVVLHAEKNGFNFSNDTVNMIVNRSEGLSPAELEHIVWTLRFEDILNPKEEDIDRIVVEIRRKHRAEKKASNPTQTSDLPQMLPPDLGDDFEDDIDDDLDSDEDET